MERTKAFCATHHNTPPDRRKSWVFNFSTVLESVDPGESNGGGPESVGGLVVELMGGGGGGPPPRRGGGGGAVLWVGGCFVGGGVPPPPPSVVVTLSDRGATLSTGRPPTGPPLHPYTPMTVAAVRPCGCHIYNIEPPRLPGAP
jgi:hypothetical protein